MSSNETPNSPPVKDGSLDDLLDSVQNHLQISSQTSSQISSEEEDIPVLTEVVQSAPMATVIGAEQPLAEPDEVETSLSTDPGSSGADSSGTEVIEVATAAVDSMDIDVEFDLAADGFSELEPLTGQDLTTQDPATQSTTTLAGTETLDESPPDIISITDSDQAPFLATPAGSAGDPLESEESPVNLFAETPANDDEAVETLQQSLDQTDNREITDTQVVPADSPAPIAPAPTDEENQLADHVDLFSDDNFPGSPSELNPEIDVEVSTDIAPAIDSAPIDAPTPVDVEVLAGEQINDGAIELSEESSKEPSVETIFLANDQAELPDIMEMNLDDFLEPEPEPEPDFAITADTGAETNSDDELPGDPVNFDPVNLSSLIEDQSAVQANRQLPADQADQNLISNPQQRLEQIDNLIDQRCQSLAAELKLELRSLLDGLDSDLN